nr:phosphoglucomutase, cytoplasmic 2 [Tanacetum cinerariifolium]
MPTSVVWNDPAANEVKSVWVGQNRLMSTPDVSTIVHERVCSDVSLFDFEFSLSNISDDKDDMGEFVVAK